MVFLVSIDSIILKFKASSYSELEFCSNNMIEKTLINISNDEISL